MTAGVTAGWEPVAAAFADAFDGKPEMGAAVAVFQHGEPVVDLFGGIADRRTGQPWTEETLSVIFSCTKGLVSLLAARLVQEGRIDIDAPVTDYWPEFGSAGKERTLVRHLLAHRAGLSAPRVDMTHDDLLSWDRAVAILAAQRPLWTPGDGWAYHAITHGWLAGEVIRRVTGLSVGGYLQELVTGPLGVEAWIGLPAEHQNRVAYMDAGPTLRELTRQQEEEQGQPGKEWLLRAMTLGGALPPDLVAEGGFSDPRVRAAEIPGAGGIATARALAAIWSATVAPTFGARLLDDSVLDLVLTPQVDGPPVFDVPPPWPRWGVGFQLGSPAREYLSGSSFGHDGAGGQVAFADREHGIGFAFLTNQMEAIDDQRATRIIDAVRECVSP
jgi:CubicO group peptidase (beta-lactamase class C family)